MKGYLPRETQSKKVSSEVHFAGSFFWLDSRLIKVNSRVDNNSRHPWIDQGSLEWLNESFNEVNYEEIKQGYNEIKTDHQEIQIG